MKKYSLRYHLLNEENSPEDNITRENQETTYSFNLNNIGEFGNIKSNLTADSLNDLLYLLSKEDLNLFKNVLLNNIDTEASSVIKNNAKEACKVLNENVESLKKDLNNLVLQIIQDESNQEVNASSDIGPLPKTANNNTLKTAFYNTARQAANDDTYQAQVAGYIRDTSGKKNLFESLFALAPKEMKAIDVIEQSNKIDAEQKKVLISVIETLRQKISQIDELLTATAINSAGQVIKLRDEFSLIKLFDQMPSKEDLRKSITKVADAQDRDEFKERMQVCIYQSCKLHKPKYILEKVTKLSTEYCNERYSENY